MREHAVVAVPDVDPLARDVLTRTLVGTPGAADAAPDGRAPGPTWSYLAVPSAATPRLLLRADRRGLGVAAARRQLSGRSRRAVVRRSALVLLLGSGAARLDRSRIVTVALSGASDTLLARVGAAVGTDVELAGVSLGPPRANRKPVLQVTDRRGDVVAWVKVGHDDLTGLLVATERVALGEVAGQLAGRVHVPRVLAGGRWQDAEVLVMAPLPTAAKGTVAGDALLELVRTVHGTTGAPAAAPLARLVALGGGRLAPLASLAAEVDLARPQLRPGAWHGDLHRDNLAVAADGTPVLWDWERWQDGVPLGCDLLHHDLQRRITVDRTPLRTAADTLVATAADRLGPLGVPADAAALVVAEYLIRLAARYVADGQADAGAAVGDVESWIVPALLGATTRR